VWCHPRLSAVEIRPPTGRDTRTLERYVHVLQEPALRPAERVQAITSEVVQPAERHG